MGDFSEQFSLFVLSTNSLVFCFCFISLIIDWMGFDASNALSKYIFLNLGSNIVALEKSKFEFKLANRLSRDFFKFLRRLFPNSEKADAESKLLPKS